MTVTPAAPRAGDAVRTDDRHPATRLGRLLDPGSLLPMHPADDSGVTAVRGRIGGFPVVAYCTDTPEGRALGVAGVRPDPADLGRARPGGRCHRVHGPALTDLVTMSDAARNCWPGPGTST